MAKKSRAQQDAARNDRVVRVSFSDDAARVLAVAGAWLAQRPVEHNLILTLLHHRAAFPQEGRYWIVAADGDAVLGVVFQSPTTFHATVTPMDSSMVDEVVDAVADHTDLPGVMGEAATASRFAGRWTEVRNTSAQPAAGQRLYELGTLTEPVGIPGALRVATEDDGAMLIDWMHGFNADTGEHGTDPAEVVPLRVRAGHFRIWDDGAPVAMAAVTPPLAGVTRIQAVYTPPERRRHGYAEATVGALSREQVAAGHRCILYTDLANATSNSATERGRRSSGSPSTDTPGRIVATPARYRRHRTACRRARPAAPIGASGCRSAWLWILCDPCLVARYGR